jgi:hypothetical protein
MTALSEKVEERLADFFGSRLLVHIKKGRAWDAADPGRWLQKACVPVYEATVRDPRCTDQEDVKKPGPSSVDPGFFLRGKVGFKNRARRPRGGSCGVWSIHSALYLTTTLPSFRLNSGYLLHFEPFSMLSESECLH